MIRRAGVAVPDRLRGTPSLELPQPAQLQRLERQVFTDIQRRRRLRRVNGGETAFVILQVDEQRHVAR
ncbi:MAG: hypothetical protein ABIW79_10320, partial [Gemmatimonas sp.]